MQDVARWMFSDQSLALRVAIGLAVFALLAWVDYRAHGERATRWREYLFLLFCILFAIAYGIVNDLITSRISVEYFLYGKGVAERVDAAVLARPELHRGRLDLEAMRIGTLATWAAGLLAGVALLITNSIGSRPRLKMRQLLWALPLIGLCAAGFATVGGLLGASGWLNAWSADFQVMIARDQWRPTRYFAVFGIHLFGYIGALLGAVAACVLIARQRRAASRDSISMRGDAACVK